MQKHYILFLFVGIQLLQQVLAGTALWAQDTQPAHIGLLYPLSTQGTMSPRYINRFSLHALTGVSGGESGFAAYGLTGLVKGDAAGVQIAGLVNLSQGNLRGVQVSGISSLAGTCTSCTQLSGIASINRGQSTVQVSGIYNHTDSVEASQIAGLVNVATKVDGLQAAGIANYADAIQGVQIGGLLNVADQVHGSQISGLINRAGTVKGVQIAGLINIADSSAHPIGILNLIKNGEKRLGWSIDENLTTVASFRSGGRKTYGIIGLGTSLQHPDLSVAIEAGLGITLARQGAFRLDAEVSNLYSTNFAGSEFSKTGIRLLPAVLLGKRLQVYGGPSLSYTHVKTSRSFDSGSISLWSRTGYRAEHSVDLGMTIGVQFIL
ncbi:MAG: hypothetical protein JJU34_08395 [Lunatimonas sp.]|uniref:hypothetical protein n=1 Tax=Lunatimonas sp. TaxID=2060141 RepID=UPI00263B982C|nr:hypothetical protein [Lunatimonas sp.]MCC5937286.1 hypothetical protein [Lunatimonas sp.]